MGEETVLPCFGNSALSDFRVFALRDVKAQVVGANDFVYW